MNIVLASGVANGRAFRDRILFRLTDGTFRDAEGEVHAREADLTNVRALELVDSEALADLDDSLDPWDLRLQLRSLGNVTVTRQLERPGPIVDGAGAGEPGGCIDSPRNPWFEPTTPSDDRFIPIVRAGYYGIWRGYGFRIRLLADARCQLIAYADPSEALSVEFAATEHADAPYVREVDQDELAALYTVEGRALIDRHLVTICGSQPGRTFATAQDVPEHERVRQLAAARRFASGEESADGVAELGTDVGISCNVAASRPLPETIEADNRDVRSVRMDRTHYRRGERGWEGDWRSRRPSIYLSRI